jgi:hypothetical protein
MPHDIAHEGDEAFLRSQTECEALAAKADQTCQILWNELHAARERIDDVDAAMRDVSARCRQIRAEARAACHRVREAFRTQRKQATVARFDFTY